MNSLDFILTTGMKDQSNSISRIDLLNESNPSEEAIKSDLFSIQNFDDLSPKVSIIYF